MAQNTGFAFVFNGMTAAEYEVASVNFDKSFAVNVMKEAADYLMSTKANQPTPLEQARQKVLGVVRENSQAIKNATAELEQIEMVITGTWAEYSKELKLRNDILKEREVTKRKRQDISALNVKLQEQFKKVGELLDKINGLKLQKNAKEVEIQDLKRVISRQKRTLDNPGKLATAMLS